MYRRTYKLRCRKDQVLYRKDLFGAEKNRICTVEKEKIFVCTYLILVGVLWGPVGESLAMRSYVGPSIFYPEPSVLVTRSKTSFINTE